MVNLLDTKNKMLLRCHRLVFSILTLKANTFPTVWLTETLRLDFVYLEIVHVLKEPYNKMHS